MSDDPESDRILRRQAFRWWRRQHPDQPDMIDQLGELARKNDPDMSKILAQLAKTLDKRSED